MPIANVGKITFNREQALSLLNNLCNQLLFICCLLISYCSFITKLSNVYLNDMLGIVTSVGCRDREGMLWGKYLPYK